MIGSIISAGAQALQGLSMKKQAKKINPVYTPYERSKYASEMLGLARQQLNARDPYAAAQEQAMYTTQANTTSAIQRNATDSSQVLALLSGVQGQTQAGLFNLGAQNQQNYQQRLSNLNQAQAVNIQEDDKVYNDKLQKYYLDLNMKTALQNGARQSFVGAAQTYGQGIDNTMAMALSAFTGGMGGGLMGGAGGAGGGLAQGQGIQPMGNFNNFQSAYNRQYGR